MIESGVDLSAEESLAPLPWQQGEWEQLQAMVKRASLPHALLLSGLEGTGKKQFARALIQGLLCSQSQQGVACGECRSCARFQAGNAPNVISIEPEEGKQGIAIEQVRSMISFLELSEQAESGKYAVLSPAESMSIGAANSLLKTLEEPSGTALIILLASRPARLPATILSRCRHIGLSEPSFEEAGEWLRKKGVERPELPLMLSGGAPLKSLGLVEDDSATRFEGVIKSVGGLLVGRAAYAGAIEVWREIEPELLLDWMLVLVERLVRRSFGVPLASKGASVLLEKLENLAPKFEKGRLQKAYAQIMGLKGEYNSSMSKEVFLDRLVLIWNDVAKKT